MTYTVAYLVGSASEDSLNRRLARALAQAAPASMELVEAEIAGLPFYRPELDREFPEIGARLKSVVEESDGVVLVTPEYNRAVPAVLRNALDWLSRPMGLNSLTGKPVMIAGATPGAVGSAVAQAELRSVLGFFNARLMGQPELYIRIRKEQFDEDGRAATPGTQELLERAMSAFEAHIASFGASAA